MNAIDTFSKARQFLWGVLIGTAIVTVLFLLM